jgi:putative membrane protein
MMAKSHPRLAEGGENVPLDVLRVMTEWLSELESRGTVPGNALASMYGCISSFEDSLSGTYFFNVLDTEEGSWVMLSALERILTTPLPL